MEEFEKDDFQPEEYVTQLYKKQDEFEIRKSLNQLNVLSLRLDKNIKKFVSENPEVMSTFQHSLTGYELPEMKSTEIDSISRESIYDEITKLVVQDQSPVSGILERTLESSKRRNYNVLSRTAESHIHRVRTLIKKMNYIEAALLFLANFKPKSNFQNKKIQSLHDALEVHLTSMLTKTFDFSDPSRNAIVILGRLNLDEARFKSKFDFFLEALFKYFSGTYSSNFSNITISTVILNTDLFVNEINEATILLQEVLKTRKDTVAFYYQRILSFLEKISSFYYSFIRDIAKEDSDCFKQILTLWREFDGRQIISIEYLLQGYFINGQKD